MYGLTCKDNFYFSDTIIFIRMERQSRKVICNVKSFTTYSDQGKPKFNHVYTMLVLDQDQIKSIAFQITLKF